MTGLLLAFGDHEGLRMTVGRDNQVMTPNSVHAQSTAQVGTVTS